MESEIKNFIGSCEGVLRVNWLKGRRIGSGFYLDTAVEVDASITVKQGHDIADEIRRAVREKFDDVIDILVHIEPSLEFKK